MKFKFIVVLLCGLLFTGTVSGFEGAPPTLNEPPADAVIGQQFISAGSGALCTLYGEKRMGVLYTYWSRDWKTKSADCLPADTGTPPLILFYDEPETILIDILVRTDISFHIAFPDSIDPDVASRVSKVKAYVVDTKTGKAYKVSESYGTYYQEESIKTYIGTITYQPAYREMKGGLYVHLNNGNFNDPYEGDSLARLFDLRAAGLGIYNFVIEFTDGNNNSSYAAIPINVQYMGE